VNKTQDEYFIDWESTAFGFGYGTGEEHVLRALKSFFAAFGVTYGDDHRPNSYDYCKLEEAVTAPVAWLLINRLCSHQLDVIEYGSSPRYGWLTPNGEKLKEYIDGKTVEEMDLLVNSTTQDSTICYPDACNCGPSGFIEGRHCNNPFWPKR
jgi:hypothetical protein